jgi:hypothetical protein
MGGIGGAGIGGGLKEPHGGTIVIRGGTITVTGGQYGAGIGGGRDEGYGGTVTITGGIVTATGGTAGIGPGNRGRDFGTIVELSGNAVVFASHIAPALTAGSNAIQAIVFNGSTGTMYGDVTLQQDVTIPAGRTLSFLSGSQTLTVPSGVTLTNDGTINKNGGAINGTVGGAGTVNDN